MACLALAKLINRKVLRIIGPDCYPYLQSLLSNDLSQLYDPVKVPKRKYAPHSSNAISSFMLNPQGRAICDMFIYRTPGTRFECEFTPPNHATQHDELLIDCDSTLASGLANTLFGYRVRRKVTIAIENDISVWALFPELSEQNLETQLMEGKSIMDLDALSSKELIDDSMTVVNDPRLSNLGLRILSKYETSDKLKQRIQSLIGLNVKSLNQTDYRLYRYTLGVGEGVKDHPESNCFPLECNADFLGSVSFTKGCYLGQELTARIHFTGVVRKRLMPILIESGLDTESNTNSIPPGMEVEDADTNRKVGIVRHACRNRALALLRLDLVSQSHQLVLKDSKMKVSAEVPYWWRS